MSSGLVGRALRVLEYLADEPGGLGLQALAEKMQIPMPSVHRLLGELTQHGYVLQLQEAQKYRLTTKLVSLGFQSLSANGIVEFAQPILNQLALTSKELVRLAIVDGTRLTWIAKAQGAGSGLRYDPDMGREAALFCTSAGHAWLASLPEEEALRIVLHQGFGNPDDHGPNAPRTIADLVIRLHETRERGYAVVIDSAAVGTCAMAAPIATPKSGRVVGVVSIAGPSARFGESRMAELAPELLKAAANLRAICPFIGYFQDVDEPPPPASTRT